MSFLDMFEAGPAACGEVERETADMSAHATQPSMNPGTQLELDLAALEDAPSAFA